VQILQRFWERFRTREWTRGAPCRGHFGIHGTGRVAGATGNLHAKCVIVDGAAVFVSSANFTEAAQQRNIEVGLLIRSVSLADGLAEYFQALAEADLTGSSLLIRQGHAVSGSGWPGWNDWNRRRQECVVPFHWSRGSSDSSSPSPWMIAICLQWPSSQTFHEMWPGERRRRPSRSKA